MVNWVDKLSNSITKRILKREIMDCPKDNGESENIKRNLESIREEIENNLPDNSIKEETNHYSVL